jgi:hypothetical protein
MKRQIHFFGLNIQTIEELVMKPNSEEETNLLQGKGIRYRKLGTIE